MFSDRGLCLGFVSDFNEILRGEVFASADSVGVRVCVVGCCVCLCVCVVWVFARVCVSGGVWVCVGVCVGVCSVLCLCTRLHIQHKMLVQVFGIDVLGVVRLVSALQYV